MRNFESLQALKQCVGQEIAVSDWIVVDQARIDKFADTTEDLNWVHVDPVRAAQGPFGKTIAHGFLTLSLLPLILNKSIAVAKMESVAPIDGNPGYQITWEVTMERDGGDKPVCVAEKVHRRYG